MIPLSEEFAHWAGIWFGSMLQASWQGAIVIGAVWCVCRLARSMPASVRCWLWRLALIKLGILAIWPGTIDLPLLPATDVPMATAPSTTQQETAVSAMSPEPRGTFASPAATSGPPTSGRDVDPRVTLPGVLALIWAAGILAVIVALMTRMRSACRWRIRCTLVKDPDILSLAERLSGELGLYQPPVLLASDDCSSPVVFGAVRTSVVLPTNMLHGGDLRSMRMILGHELAHIRRADLVWNWVGTGVWAVFFFHPLVWIALRELRLNQELACDALAVSSPDASRVEYGRLLIDLADQERRPSNMLISIGVVESYEFLKRRLRAMSESHPVSRWIKPVSLSLLSIAVLGLLPWRLVAQTPTPAAPRVSAAQKEVVTGQRGTAKDDDKVQSAPLARTIVGDFEIAVTNVRWTKGSPLALVDNGFPVRLNSTTTHETRVSGPGYGAGGSAGGGAGSGVFYVPNLAFDLHVTSRRNSRQPLICSVVGKVNAVDNQGNEIDSPDLPAHLTFDERPRRYPAGSGTTGLFLNVKDKNTKQVKAVSGELLMCPVHVCKGEFDAEDFSRPASRKSGDMTIHLYQVRTAEDGIDVEIGYAVEIRGNGRFIDQVRRIHKNRGLFECVLEDSEGRIHTFQQGSGGGGGGAAGGGSFVEGGPRGSRNSGSVPPPTFNYSLHFAALPEGVTAKRIICRVTQLAGEPQRVPLKFNDLPIP